MPSSRRPTARLALCAALTALALGLSAAESLIPLTVLLPLPGLRLGLANLVTLVALCRLSRREVALILVGRCLLSALLGGNPASLWFSLSGGLLSLLAMCLLLLLPRLSLLGVAVGGAAAHNLGQVLAAMLYFRSPAPALYLPALLFCSVFTGAVTGLCAMLVLRRLPAALSFRG